MRGRSPVLIRDNFQGRDGSEHGANNETLRSTAPPASWFGITDCIMRTRDLFLAPLNEEPFENDHRQRKSRPHCCGRWRLENDYFPGSLRVARSCSQATSLLFGEATFNGNQLTLLQLWRGARIDPLLDLGMTVRKGETRGVIVVARGVIDDHGFGQIRITVHLSHPKSVSS